MIIQMVYLPQDSTYLFIRGIKPDENDPNMGQIAINGCPTKCLRKETYIYSNNHLVTESFSIPMDYVINFLIANGHFQEDENGNIYAMFGDVNSELF